MNRVKRLRKFGEILMWVGISLAALSLLLMIILLLVMDKLYVLLLMCLMNFGALAVVGRVIFEKIADFIEREIERENNSNL
ncbi:MAG: hypothetical protein IKC47_00320 [Clostridia bacterium]|nr:hypothetical protein [Clostridia bacterium]